MAFEITDGNFKQVISENKIVVIDFWADWCGPCKMITPFIEAIAEEYKDQALVGKCNVDDNIDATAEFGIRNIPTILFFKDGKQVDKMVGGNTKAAIEDKLKALL
ncbi:MAG TPA: thioredoxin [Bacteroidaceae bacterium]|nr:thioredoxin [Bacteroidaceae bacterium]